MKIDLSEYPEFKQLFLDDGERINDKHRRGSTFYCDVVMEVTQEDERNFDTGTFPPDPVGYWLVKGMVWSDDYGYDSTDFINAIKVERKERQVTTTEVYYKPVNQ